MRRVATRSLSVVLGLVALTCTSCGKGTRYYPVHGQILLDGKPPKGALVVLHPADAADMQALRPSAYVKADGSFDLKSFEGESAKTREGAPPGEYLVTVAWYPPDTGKPMDSFPDKLGGRYSDPKTSGLRAEIKPGPTTLPPFELTLKK